MTSPQKTVENWFNFITESRADGLSWTEIERRLAQKGCPVSKGYLKVLYQKEVARRSSPERSSNMRWLYENYHKISCLLENNNLAWDMIVAILPPPEMTGDPMCLCDLISDFKRIKEAMALRQSNGLDRSTDSSREQGAPSQLTAKPLGEGASRNEVSQIERQTERPRQNRIYGDWSDLDGDPR